MTTLSLLKTLTAAAVLTLALTACGGGGCDAGVPVYQNQKYDCDTAPGPTTPASGAQR